MTVPWTIGVTAGQDGRWRGFEKRSCRTLAARNNHTPFLRDIAGISGSGFGDFLATVKIVVSAVLNTELQWAAYGQCRKRR